MRAMVLLTVTMLALAGPALAQGRGAGSGGGDGGHAGTGLAAQGSANGAMEGASPASRMDGGMSGTGPATAPGTMGPSGRDAVPGGGFTAGDDDPDATTGSSVGVGTGIRR